MTVSVYVDSCAWNFLFENKCNLAEELPHSRYTICITREVEIELSTIPDVGHNGVDKRELKAYIKQGIYRLPVTTSYVFGFQTLESDGTPSPVQVHGGFDVGTFQSDEERAFYARPEVMKQLQSGKKANTGLGKNEADASLAVKSLSSIVLTNERRGKAGPLKLASDLGGRVVYLEEQVKPSGLTIGKYLELMGAD